MVFGNFAGLLPAPNVAVKPAPVANSNFAITSALGEIGTLVKKKADVEALRAEANQYANYAQENGNESIAGLLRARADKYSLLTDTNQERSSLLKGVTTLTELEETERRNNLVNAVSQYDNMVDNKITASQQNLAKTVQLYNNWERNYANEKKAYQAAAARNPGFVKPFTERVNPWAAKYKADEAAYQGLIQNTPDRINKSAPSNAVPFAEVVGQPALPTPGSPLDATTGPGTQGMAGGALFPDQSGSGPEGQQEPLVPETSPPASSIAPQLTGTPAPADPAVLPPPSGTFAPLSQTPTPLTYTPVNTSPVVVGPTIGAPATNAVPQQPVAENTTKEPTISGAKYINVPPPPTSLPEGYDSDENRAKLARMQDQYANVEIYNRGLRLLDKSLNDKEKFRNPAQVEEAKKEIREAGKLISGLPNVGSEKWLVQAEKTLKETEGLIGSLSKYTTAQQDANSAAAGQQAIEVMGRADAEGTWPDKPATKVMTGFRRLGADGKYRISMPDKDTGVLKDITDDTDKRGSTYITGKLLGPAPMAPGQKTVNVAPGAPPPQASGKITPETSAKAVPPVSGSFKSLRDIGAETRKQ